MGGRKVKRDYHGYVRNIDVYKRTSCINIGGTKPQEPRYPTPSRKFRHNKSRVAANYNGHK